MADALLQTSQDSVNIDSLISSSFISNVEKIENKLGRGIQTATFTEKLDFEILKKLASTLIENTHKIEAWSDSHKKSDVKIEADAEGPENEEDKEEDLFALEKQEFSFLPLLQILIE